MRCIEAKRIALLHSWVAWWHNEYCYSHFACFPSYWCHGFPGSWLPNNCPGVFDCGRVVQLQKLYVIFILLASLQVDVMISRDLDSRITARESAAVGEWISSNKSFHVMRDHPDHGTFMLGESLTKRSSSFKGNGPSCLSPLYKANQPRSQLFHMQSLYPIQAKRNKSLR